MRQVFTLAEATEKESQVTSSFLGSLLRQHRGLLYFIFLIEKRMCDGCHSSEGTEAGIVLCISSLFSGELV